MAQGRPRKAAVATLSATGGELVPDIKPNTPIAALDRSRFADATQRYDVATVAALVGMAPIFVRRVTGRRSLLSAQDVLLLLDQDAFRETMVPRSRILDYLDMRPGDERNEVPNPKGFDIRVGNALDLLREVPAGSVQCIVTSTPYWGMRVYEDSTAVLWADGERCPYGHEQTPEGFARHTAEVLHAAAHVLTDDGSIWWNVMDSFNTRTQIRGSAVEALRAMQGLDGRKWAEHTSRRYSAGHSHLKDGEQCLVPAMIADRASRLGLYVKTVITWAKRSSLPEPQDSRVSRNLEYVVHLSKQRTPKLSRGPYHTAKPEFGGRNNGWESEKLSDVWVLNTSNGGNGHGAQFPTALPGRCIALSTTPGDVVLDPFVGSGNSGIAAVHHGCAFLGFDVSPTYAAITKERIGKAATPGATAPGLWTETP